MQLPILFVFAFLVRLINLNQSLWLDESIVAKVVKYIPFFQIPFQLSPGDVHPPLYYMIVSLWTSMFGTSELMLRMPSVLFSLLAGWFVYKIGVELKGKTIGVWAAAFFLFNPLIIYYSQEARMHMMATALLTMALYYFVVLIKEKQNITFTLHNIILFNLFSALAMCTFYGSAFFIAAMIVTSMFVIPVKIGIQNGLLYRFRIRAGMTIVFSAGLILSLIIISPLLYQQILNAHAGLADLKNWSMALGKAELKNVLMIFLKFATGRLSWFPKWSYYLIAGVPTALIWLFTLFGMKKNRMLASLFILPILFGLFISFWAPMMMYFRFLYLLPVMCILLVLGANNAWSRRVILTLLFIFSCVYLVAPQFHREDWKTATQSLRSERHLYMILPSSDPILYYRPDVSVFELRDVNKAPLPEAIDVIPYTSEIYGLNYVQLLQRSGCIKESQSSFRGDVIIERWKCLRNA